MQIHKAEVGGYFDSPGASETETRWSQMLEESRDWVHDMYSKSRETFPGNK